MSGLPNVPHLHRAHGGSRTAWRWALLLALTATAFGLLLGGVSAWFLGSVAIAGLTATAFTFNFHIPSALIRLFAVGRTAARYGERLVGHKAALADQAGRRARLFSAMAAAPELRRTGWQFGDPARLADYLDDVEDLDYARLRAGLPAMTTALALAAGIGGTLFVAPAALVPIAILLAAIALSGRRLERRGWPLVQSIRRLQRAGADAYGAAAVAVVPLKAERRWENLSAASLARFSEADLQMLALRRLQAGFDALAAAFGPAAALATLGAAYLGGARGEDLLVPAFLAFVWIAFAETALAPSRILVARLRERAAGAEIADKVAPDADANPPSAVQLNGRLAASALQRQSPAGRPLGRPLALDLQAGRPTVLVGPSGSGKTSLLKQIAGWIGEDLFLAGDRELPASSRRRLCRYCPHDAAILADTVRANLFAPNADDEALHRALEAVEMDERVARAGGLDGWIVQDTLSLGEAQRLNLARAWLSTEPLVLLDEPIEHLDETQGLRILERLLEHLGDRIVVLSTHHAVTHPGAVKLDLQGTP